MNYVDGLLLFVLVLALWGGWSRGFILGTIDLLVLAGSVTAGIYFYPYVQNFMLRYVMPNNALVTPISFIATLVIARIILSLLARLIIQKVSPAVHINTFNRFLGLLPGLVNGLIYCAILSALFLAVPISQDVTEHTRNSRIAPKLALQVEWFEDALSPVFDVAVNRSINKMTVEPESKTTIDLQFTVEDAKMRPDFEDQMLTLINAERMKRKLRALVADPTLVPVARAHSTDMFARGYFSHQSPEGLTPADRVKKAGIKYLIMGENLALGQTLSICHRGLMNSPGHRANILSTAYGRVGIGIVDGGVHGLMITQEFRN